MWVSFHFSFPFMAIQSVCIASVWGESFIHTLAILSLAVDSDAVNHFPGTDSALLGLEGQLISSTAQCALGELDTVQWDAKRFSIIFWMSCNFWNSDVCVLWLFSRRIWQCWQKLLLWPTTPRTPSQNCLSQPALLQLSRGKGHQIEKGCAICWSIIGRLQGWRVKGMHTGALGLCCFERNA